MAEPQSAESICRSTAGWQPFSEGLRLFIFHAPRSIGAVLILAASLKVHSVLTGPHFSTPWLDIPLVEAEAICGFALLLNLWPALARPINLTLFAVLFIGAARSVANGEPCCACFGKVQLTPWFALLFDVVASVSLWYWRPQKGWSTKARHLVVLSPLALIPFLFPTGADAAYPQLVVAHPDLGEVRQATRIDAGFHILNPHEQAVTIREIESSCPCFSAVQLPWTIPPSSKSSHTGVLNLREEPGFSGLMQLELRGKTEAGQQAFALRIRAKVVPE